MEKYGSPVCPVLAVVVTVFFTQTSDAVWYDTNWQYRKRITIDNNKVDANLTGFPVLINLATDVELAANTQNDGDDILFTSSDQISKIPHEVEFFDGGSGQLIAWVNVPSLSASVDTDIYIYYGNASAGSQEDVANVWDANFVKVLHLQETPNGALDELNDSSGSGNHGQTFSMGAGNSVIGQIGRGLNFVRAEALDQIRVYDSASLDGTADEGTLEFWINFVAAPPPATYYLIMVHSLRFSTGNGMEQAWRADDNFFMYPNAGDPGGQTWSGATIPRGVEFKYLLYINNYAAARSDVSVRDLLDPLFQCQPGTIQADNSVAACAATTCTPAEEQAIFAAVTGTAFLSDAADGDTASYSVVSASVDAGDGNAANAQLNIDANAVWAISFSVKLP